MPGLTKFLDAAAVLDHVDGDVVVVNAFSGRVDAGKPGAAGAAEVRGAVRRAVLRDHTGARAAVSAVVAFENNDTAQRQSAKFAKGSW